MAVTRALVDPQTLAVNSVVSMAPSTKQWTISGIVYWCCAVAAGQTPQPGDLYAPVNSPITLDNVFLGGTYTSPPPAIPPIGQSKDNATAAVMELSDKKVSDIMRSTDAVAATQRYSQLEAAVTAGTATPAEISEYSALSTKYAYAIDVQTSRDALVAWIAVQTDAQLMADFNAAAPPVTAPQWPAPPA